MSEETNGITVNHTYEIDWWTLGKSVANQNSDDQAMFLHGLATGFNDMGGNYGIQFLAMLESVQKLGETHAGDVSRLLEELHDYSK